MLTSHCDSGFERSNINFNKNIKMDGIDWIMTVLTSAFERMEGKFYGLWFVVLTTDYFLIAAWNRGWDRM